MKLSGNKSSMSPSVSPPTVAFGQFGYATHNSHNSHNATSTSSQAMLMSSESASSGGQSLEVTPVSVTTSSPVSAGAATPVTMPSGPQPPRAPSGTTPCCESGRPVITNPITGQTVCSCQYDAHLLNYQRLAASTGLSLGMYGPSAAAEGFLPLPPGQLPSAFYPPTANGFDLKENLEAWKSLPYAAASMYYPYDGGALAGYPFANGYGMDLNGARRKNATRETTSTLKAWLSEHRKNPYPTKGEKIMLAIITKMTLTQVSTWFANARRRLKKENKMTWSPRNRCDDDDDAAGSPRNRCDDDTDNAGSPANRSDDDVDVDVDADDSSESRINDRLMNTQDVDAINSSQRRDASQSASNSNANELNIHLPHTSTNRPRIWSIVDIATNTSTNSSSTARPNFVPNKR